MKSGYDDDDTNTGVEFLILNNYESHQNIKMKIGIQTIPPHC